MYTNRDDLDFGAVQELPPVQKWELAENLQGQIELPTQVPLPCTWALFAADVRATGGHHEHH